MITHIELNQEVFHHIHNFNPDTVKCDIQYIQLYWETSRNQEVFSIIMQVLNMRRKHIWLLTFSFESCEDKDEIIVEVRELVELFKFLAW